MSQSSTRPLAVLCIGLLVAFPLAAQMPLPPPDSMPTAEPEPARQWLDEVRAQRQIWQEQRRTAQKARRRIDPWGAARQERQEQEAQRHHDAILEHIEHDREAFRNQGPWQLHQRPWQTEAFRFSAPPSSQPPANAAAGASGQAPPRTLTYPLPGWDNRWYYRGF